ncbi:MAG: hypothetical protein ACRBBR_00670 [Cellvibrionaceae bacterium]
MGAGAGGYSASSSTGAQGGDSFVQDFGGINVNETSMVTYIMMGLMALALVFIAVKVFA